MFDGSELLIKIGAGVSVLASMAYVAVNGMIDGKVANVEERVSAIRSENASNEAYNNERMRQLYSKIEVLSDDVVEMKVMLGRIDQSVRLLSTERGE